MNFPACCFPSAARLAANTVCLLLFTVAIRKALPVLSRHHRATLTGLLIVVLCWSLHAAPANGHLHGISYHLLGISLLVLMVDIPAAFCLAGMLLLPYIWLWQGAENLSTAGLGILASIMPPILCTALARRIVQRLPRNLFIYIFINGFFAAAAGVLLSATITGLLLYAADVFSGATLLESALPVFLLIAWGEAFLTGLLTAIFISLAPQLIITFSDTDHLRQNTRYLWK